MDRESSKQALKKVTEQGLDRIHSGITVVVFPEGTRADPGESLPFQIGGAYLASKCNAPVVPVAHNAGTVWPKGAPVKGPGVIRVVIGEPIMPGLRAQALNDRVETWIRAQNTTSETLLG
ncbi:MAG: 1-acyl-sn-glycerol-3-phosphate acyltransferase [Rhodocyclales bacterium]|nr:1-acyl-sn-glycerol-3-phosphate acyltransferase [Rhodocyclales bacterium]